jgi:hypothetical protein
LYMPGKQSTIGLHPQPLFHFLLMSVPFVADVVQKGFFPVGISFLAFKIH